MANKNNNNLIDRVRAVVARMVENREFVADVFAKQGDEIHANEQLTGAIELRVVYTLLTNIEILEQFEAVYGFDQNEVRK